MWALLFFFGLLLVGFLVGLVVERNHFAELDRREDHLKKIGVTNVKRLPADFEAAASKLCIGSVVIGTDYFKRFASGLKSLVGGRLNALDKVVQRGRREAVARMLEDAESITADYVYNVRIETSTIGFGAGDQGFMAAEVVAYGTAVRSR